MANTNIIVIAGNLTRDPELRYTPAGTAVCNLGLANSQKFVGKDGQQNKRTTFVRVTCWEKQAETAAASLKKGDPVLIEGQLSMDSWTDNKTGEKRTTLEIRANRVQFLAPRHATSEHAEEGPGNVGPAF